MAQPNIADVLAQFLADHRARLGAKTFARYRSIVVLRQHDLNGYGYQRLKQADSTLFDRPYNAKGTEHRDSCQVIRPEHILANLGDFLDYFMIRKVIAGTDLMRAAGTVTKKLAVWLSERGYVTAEAAADGVDRGASAARDLPRAE